jgi:hypothetical protein
MSSIVDTSFLNFSFTNSISGKYTQVQKNSYIKSIQSQEDAANTRISALGKLLNSLAEDLETTVNSYIDSVIPGQQDTYRALINEYIKAEKTTYKSFNR